MAEMAKSVKKMLEIMKTCFDQTEKEYHEQLDYIIQANDNPEYKKLDIEMLKPKELEMLEYMKTSYENSGQFPSQTMIYSKYPGLPPTIFNNISVILLEDFGREIANFIIDRINERISERLKELPGDIAKSGITDSISERFDEFKRLSAVNSKPDIKLRQSFREIYDEKLNRPRGMLTGIKHLDKLIGGMEEGTVTAISGFTSHFKTLFAMNVAYLNSYVHGYNIAYLTLETPKEMMYWQLLARHSYDTKFTKYSHIPHEKIKNVQLTVDEREYMTDVIEPDIYADYPGADGQMKMRGLVTFLDLQDFDTFSFIEITAKLEALDDLMNGYLDCVVVDYIQLCKFSQGMTIVDDNKMINSYVSFFRKLSQSFRFGQKKKKLIVILLSQINRTSWQRASRNEGRYDLTCLADANELERGSNRVITTYTTEAMKISKNAQVQLLKNRSGATNWDPEKVYADPELYIFGDEIDTAQDMFSGSYSNSNHSTLADIFSALDEDDMF